MFFHRVSRAASIPARAVALVICLFVAAPSGATTLLRDADIEYGLAQLAFPLLRAAGLSPSRMRVLVVDDLTMNAFVVDNKTIYVNSGLILKTKSAAMLQAVIAHEAAHIANGHLARRMSNMRSARTAAGLGMAMAMIAAVAGGGDAAAGIAIGSASSAQRVFFKHTRAEESAADRSAASYLAFAGVSPQGLVDLHELFKGQELLTTGLQDPYAVSHPLTADRIRAAKAFLKKYGNSSQPRPDDDYWFARIKGKLSAFARSSKWTMRRITAETYPDIKQMRRAVAFHRQRALQPALLAIDRALAIRPEDAYYLDLKAQILMENRRVNAAIEVFETAVELAPREALILGGYGRALLAAGRPEQALEQLEKARTRDFRNARVLRDLGAAYARTGQDGKAALATAERQALEGDMEGAARQARRASGLLPRGSVGWQQAEDLLATAEKFLKTKKR